MEHVDHAQALLDDISEVLAELGTNTDDAANGEDMEESLLGDIDRVDTSFSEQNNDGMTVTFRSESESTEITLEPWECVTDVVTREFGLGECTVQLRLGGEEIPAGCTAEEAGIQSRSTVDVLVGKPWEQCIHGGLSIGERLEHRVERMTNLQGLTSFDAQQLLHDLKENQPEVFASFPDYPVHEDAWEWDERHARVTVDASATPFEALKPHLALVGERMAICELEFVPMPLPKEGVAPLKVNMMPIILGDLSTVPTALIGYRGILLKCMEYMDKRLVGSVGYITVDESHVEKDQIQRRGGAHTECPGGYRSGMYVISRL